MTAKFWIGGTGTWDNTNDVNWSLSSGGANNTTHPVSTDTVTFDGASGGGTVTVNATISANSITCGAFTGTLDFSANNNNVNLSASPGFSISGAGTRTINMGNGIWTISVATGTLFDATTKTGLTFNANSSTIAISAATPTGSRSFIGNGLTFSTITVAATTTTGQLLNITTGPTIGTLTVTEPVNITFGAGVTTTITNAVSFSGTSGAPGYVVGAGNGVATLSVAGGCTINWMAVANITFTGSAVSPTNSFDLRGNNFNGGALTGPTSGGHIIGG